MSTFVDDAVVLRRVDYGDHDRVLTVLTRTHGKLGVIARGVRKPGSHLAAHTDLFVRSTMQLARGRGELEVLVQAQGRPAAPPADRGAAAPDRARGGEARRAACVALCAELADRVLEAGHPLDDGIFDLVVDALTACADPSRDPRAAMAWFARRMIDRLGYAPELVSCASCAVRLSERPGHFSAAGGGLLCDGCARGDTTAVECPVRVIKVLRIIAAGDDVLYARLRLDGATLAVLEAVVERELEQHVDRRLRSLAVLRALWADGPAAATAPPTGAPARP